MLNQILTLNMPQNSPRSASVKTEATATPPSAIQGKPTSDSSDAFGALLARQMQDQTGAIADNTALLTDATAQLANSKVAAGKKIAERLTATSNQTGQDQAAPADVAAQTLATLMQANPQTTGTPGKTAEKSLKNQTDNQPPAPDAAGLVQATGIIPPAAASIVATQPAVIATQPVTTQAAVATTQTTLTNRERVSNSGIALTSTKTPAQPLSTETVQTPKPLASATPVQSPVTKEMPLATPFKNAGVTDSLKPGIDNSNTPPANLPLAAVNFQAVPLDANNAPNQIAAPLGSHAWPDEFAQKVTWVSNQQNQSAELHLNPPDLGPMSVTLTITDNQATAQFSSPHMAVREAIENAMPKLRESLADNGIMLGNATVNDQAPRDSGSNNFTQSRAPSPAAELRPVQSEPVAMPSGVTRRHQGMVDTFA